MHQVMGAAIAFNKMTMLSGLKLIKGWNSGRVRNDHFRSFMNYCDKQLHYIDFCLGSFDYISLLERGSPYTILWNAVNLFFKQGMYFEVVFTPIRMLDIENIVLDENFPTNFPPHQC